LILLDANLLIYAHIEAVPQHQTAQEWLDRQLTEASAVAFPWESITAFLRVVTNPRILERPLTIAQGWQQVKEWLASDPAWIPQATRRQTELFGELLMLPGLRANDVPDAYLAALAIDLGLILCSADTGFARFPRLRWTNPLAG
jgi:toxin-antitoxin system PIN domain toxin